MTADERDRIRRRIRAWQDEFSLERECAPYRDLTPDERAQRVEAACRGAMRLLAGRDDAASALQWQDPVPADSLRVWERLRREHRNERTR